MAEILTIELNRQEMKMLSNGLLLVTINKLKQVEVRTNNGDRIIYIKLKK